MATIVLIGGSGRSGTVITKRLLAMHPKVATLPFEYRFIIDPDGIVDFYRSYPTTWSPYLADGRLKRLEKLLKDLTSDTIFNRIIGKPLSLINKRRLLLSPNRYANWVLKKHIPGFEGYVSELLAALKEFSFQGSWVGTGSYNFRPEIYFAGPKTEDELAPPLAKFIRKSVTSILNRQGADVYVEDNTWNILSANELIRLLPEAKIVHVYRDPRDVVASFVKQKWCPTDIKKAAIWYRSIIEHWFSVRDGLPRGAYYEFKLEDLVDRTEHIVRQLCDFTGLPYHPRLLEIDLTRSNTGRWRKEFSQEESRQVQEILGSVIARLGYDGNETTLVH